MTVLTGEHRDLIDVVRRYCTDAAATLRQTLDAEASWDERAWRRAVEELGLPALALPEEHGGAGYGTFEQALVLEELGRTLLPSPYLGSVVLAANAALLAGDQPMAKELLAAIVDGVPATVAHLPSSGTPSLVGSGDAGLRLSGAWDHAVELPHARLVLVVADENGGRSLFVVERDAPGVQVTPLETLDLTRPQGRLVLDAAPARRVGAPGGFTEAYHDWVDRVRVATAAEDLGTAQACLEMSTSYAKTRVQFGRAIGSFQAVKHLCADMLIAVESARSAVWHAATVTDAGELCLAAPMARALASEAARFCARANIQVHGGIGCTWEHDAHLYYRRAEASALINGDLTTQQDLLADRLGI